MKKIFVIGVLVCGFSLSGCVAVGLTALGVGMATGVSHQLGGMVYKTFTTSQSQVKRATYGAFRHMQVKVVKLRGEFLWHHHDAEDELFLVVAGRLRMQLRDGDQEIGPGELIIVPRGVEHWPLALTDEVHVVLLEAKTTLNTGNVVNERTVATLDRLRTP